MSTAAYGGEPGDGKKGVCNLTYIPFRTTLSDGTRVEVDTFKSEKEWQVGMDLMNLIIREGKTWPFEKEFETLESYRGYFLSHAAFVVRSLEDDEVILGCFYVKPNFPGRCSHICNGGFITSPEHRNRGVATLMGGVFLQVSKDLQYKSAYFNLVFKSNIASICLWEKLGFQRVAVLENAGRLNGLPSDDQLDTAYGYRFDLEMLDAKYLWKSGA